jgi:tRNA A-37 threonylcarbamoyl transferase component Bud32
VFLKKRYKSVFILFIGLSERVQSVVVVLENGVGNDSNTKAIERTLKSLNETLKESAAFVKEFTDSSVFARFLNNSDHQQKFETLSAQLSHNATDLNLALNITSIFDHHQDVADRQADLAEILCKLDEIAFEMTKQQQELLNQNKDMQHEFKRRFDSFKFCLQQDVLKAQNPVEAKKIEEESKLFLHIPGHDLVSEELIGQGGFADVYKGTWCSQHHRVAIKTIRITDLNDNVKQNFLDEIATMHNTRFDHVLGIFGACIEPNYHALIVEYMSLGSLFDVLKKKEHIRSWEDRWSIALQMTKGVNHLHSRSILHRDIKSLNFLMDKAIDGYIVKISDFGLAKIRQETSRQTTKRVEPASVTGSLLWIAPELLKLGKPSKASDIYSLGVVLWELATGCVPYEDMDEAIISRSVKDGERLAIPDDVPTTFASIISNAWCQEPNKRPTAQALIQEIMIATPVTEKRSVT